MHYIASRVVLALFCCVWTSSFAGCDDRAPELTDLPVEDGIDSAEDVALDIPDSVVSQDADASSPDGSDATSDNGGGDDEGELSEVADSDAGSDYEETACSPVPFEVLPLAYDPTRPPNLPDNKDWVLIKTAEEYEAVVGKPPPAALDFATDWALLVRYHGGSSGSYGSVVLDLLESCPDGLHFQATVESPAEDCSTLVMRDRQAYGLATLPRQQEDPVLVDLPKTLHEFSCVDGPSEGADCIRGRLCDSGLMCAGLSRSATGICVPDSWVVHVTNLAVVAIPDGVVEGIASVNPVICPGEIPADVFVTVQVTHPRYTDLEAVLVDPDGASTTLADHEEESTWVGLSLNGSVADFEGTASSGDWTLRIVDDVPMNVGQLDAWSLTIVGRNR